MLTTLGVLEEPLGNTRLHVARLVASLLYTSSASHAVVAQELCRLNTLNLLLVRKSAAFLIIWEYLCWENQHVKCPFEKYRTCSSSTPGTTFCISKWSFVLLLSSGPVPTKWDFSLAWLPRKKSSLIQMHHQNRSWTRPRLLNYQTYLKTLLIT